MSYKRELTQLLVSDLNRELEPLTQFTSAAREAATHEDSKAENAHDTRGIEASYLAGAQQARLENLKRIIAVYQSTEFREFKPLDPIDVGALVELERNGIKSYYFLVPLSGGRNLSYKGKTIQVITPLAPITEALMGRKAGETIELESRQETREFHIISVS